MKMPYEFAKKLIDDLATLAILANKKSTSASIYEITEIEGYARNMFFRLCDGWEEEMHEKWEIVID